MPWLKVRREGVELLWCVVCYYWMMLRVDGCLNEDPDCRNPRGFRIARYMLCYGTRLSLSLSRRPKNGKTSPFYLDITRELFKIMFIAGHPSIDISLNFLKMLK